MELNPFFQSITEGVIGGIVSSAIIGFFVIVFREILLPRLENRFSSARKVNGRWGANYERIIDEDRVNYSKSQLTIRQVGEKLKGDLLILNKMYDGREFQSQYRVSGFVRGDFAVINYTPKDKSTAGLGSYFLKIHGNGMVMEGNLHVTLLKTMEVASIEHVQFEKIPSPS